MTLYSESATSGCIYLDARRHEQVVLLRVVVVEIRARCNHRWMRSVDVNAKRERLVRRIGD